MARSTVQGGGSTSRRVLRLPWRVIAGLGLVVISLVGVTGVVLAMDRAEEYVVATEDMVPGETIDEHTLATVWLHVRDRSVPYLTPVDLASSGSRVVLRLIRAGELIPRGSLGTARSDDVTVISLPLNTGGGDSLQPGNRIDVWVSAPRPDTAYSVPQVIAPGALLLAIRQEEGFAVDPNSRFLDIEVAFRDVAPLIHALANDFDIRITPTVAPGGVVP